MAGILVIGLLLTASAAYARVSPRVEAFWDRVARCETGGDWRMRGPTYSGGTGFYNRTWQSWAHELHLDSRYPNPADAPRIVQIRVSDYGYRVHHGYWGTIANGCAGVYP